MIRVRMRIGEEGCTPMGIIEMGAVAVVSVPLLLRPQGRDSPTLSG